MKKLALAIWHFLETVGQYRFEQAKRNGFRTGY